MIDQFCSIVIVGADKKFETDGFPLCMRKMVNGSLESFLSKKIIDFEKNTCNLK